MVRRLELGKNYCCLYCCDTSRQNVELWMLCAVVGWVFLQKCRFVDNINCGVFGGVSIKNTELWTVWMDIFRKCRCVDDMNFGWFSLEYVDFVMI